MPKAKFAAANLASIARNKSVKNCGIGIIGFLAVLCGNYELQLLTAFNHGVHGIHGELQSLNEDIEEKIYLRLRRLVSPADVVIDLALLGSSLLPSLLRSLR